MEAMVIEEKPEYRVSSMSEIEQIEWNGYNAISTFSGCGGSSLGYRMAGFKVLWANEFIPIAAETYRLNHTAYIDENDIRKIQPEEVLDKLGLEKGELDLMDGSPPCDSFSTAGVGSAKWGTEKAYLGKRQRTDDLFFEYARLLEGLQPKVFIAENVSGLIKGKSKGYFKLILQRLKDCGYNVKAKLLDAQWLGVPQMRQRVIFLGIRNDLDNEPIYPKPLSYRYTVKDAISFIEQVVDPVTNLGDVYKSEWDNMKQGTASPRYFNLKKTSLERSSNSILATCCITHPLERRLFTIAELKRICAFPDDFQLIGTFAEQWARLGLSVPPVMIYHIAKTIRDEILDKLKQKKLPKVL